METMEGIGHNNPPDGDELLLRLQEQHEALVKRTGDLEAAVQRVPAKLDEKSHATAIDFAKQLQTHEQKIDAARVIEKQPFLDGGRKVDGFFGGLTTTTKEGRAAVLAKIRAYQIEVEATERRAREEAARKAREAAEEAARKAREEREAAERARREQEEAERRAEAERIAALKTDADLQAAIAAQEAAEALARRQEQERQAREAEAAEAARRAAEEAAAAERAALASAADLSRTRTALGSTSSLRTVIGFAITDKAAACRVLAPLLDDDSMSKAMRKWLGLNKAAAENIIAGKADPLPGVNLFHDKLARVA